MSSEIRIICAVECDTTVQDHPRHRRNLVRDGGDCHDHFFKAEFAICQAILSFTILQFYAQRCNSKPTSRQAVPAVNSPSGIYEHVPIPKFIRPHDARQAP